MPVAPPSTSDLQARLGALTLRDERRLGRRLREARRADGTALAEVAREVEAAERLVAARRQAVPAVRYPPELPITDRRDELLAAIRDHQVVVVAGETGSGKSTQLPKLCLELGRGVRGLVGHTQPRRLAARSVAERVAEELGTSVGGAVGYTVRFTDRVGDGTLVKVMTDGILLAEIQRDRMLSAYDTLIIDEAHERSLNIDFILGYLTQLLPQRPDLKVIITSATIDTERFSRHFGDAPVIEVSGRTYPVEIRYQPVVEDAEDSDRDAVQAICDAVEELSAEGPGDVLVFLSGEREIRDTADALARLDLRHTEVLPLYARLSAAEQHRVFSPHRGRRVVLATNVAETSITVPGIRYVVDPGTARISRYNRRTKVQRLPIEAVSQASADQRAGRCGRVAPGICIRLYSEEDFLGRPEFTEPEILRTNLASVILQMAALGFGDVAAFPFVDGPDPRSIKDGVALLEELGALDPSAPDPSRALTPVGRALARLPIDPRLGRMVLEADRNGCAAEVMVIAAALSIQDPRESPADQRQAAAEHHARFADPDSDFFAYLNLWRYLQEQQDARSSNQFRKMCRAEHLHYLRVREWQDLHGQLRVVARSVGIRPNHEPGDRDRIHQSLLAGLLSHIGMRESGGTERRGRDGSGRGKGREKPGGEYLGARNARFAIAPGSALFKKPPAWVVAAELVETNRLWGRKVARIQPEWAERAGAHLVKRSYSEPRWDPARGEVVAQERVTLYGVPVVASRRVSYGRVDPEVARQLFIRHALVEGEWRAHHAFLRRNEELVEEVRALEDRARRRDLLADEEARFDFFDARVPPHVVSARHFDRWWGKERGRRPDLLTYPWDLLVRGDGGVVDADAFPDVWPSGDLALDVSYEFDPTSPTDGVTVHVPLAALHRVQAGDLDWQVPGLREELVTALIRSLPKPVRRRFVPAPDHARAVLARVGPEDGPLLEVLTRELGRLTGEPVPPGSWQLDRVPDHLRVTVQVEDEQGRALAVGKDLAVLRAELRGQVRGAVAEAARSAERTGLRSWEFGTLPRAVTSEWAGHPVTAYPALVDEGDTVGVRAFPTEAEQARAMQAGTRRLLLLTVPSPRKDLKRLLSERARFALAVAPHASIGELLDDCVACAVDAVVQRHGGPAWDEDGFAALQRGARSALPGTATSVGTMVAGILASAQGVEARLGEMAAPALVPALADVRVQLSRLLHPGFVTAAGARRLPDVLRYLRAVEHRLDRLPSAPARDRELTARVQQLEDDLAALEATAPPDLAADLDAVRWMIEELRVSLFAQQLGTAQRVSEPRLRKELARLAAAAVAG